MKKIFVIGLAIIVFAGQASFAGIEKDITLSEVPETVMKVLSKRFNDATFHTANTETETDGTLVYEVQGALADGKAVEFDVLANGEIEEIEIIFTTEMVPGAVIKAINAKLPGFIPSKIEASHSASMKVVGYEFEGMLNGQTMDLEVSADGRIITIADN